MYAPLVTRADTSRKRKPTRAGGKAPERPFHSPLHDSLEAEADRAAQRIADGEAPPAISRIPTFGDCDTAWHPAPPASGRALPEQERRYFESRFGRDFSTVRVHAEGRAAESARTLGARAYTCGRDIVFGPGEYAPGSRTGRALLSHELTHVVQQGGRPGFVQLSPLSDSLKDSWAAEPRIEALLARLSKADIQVAQGDADIDAELARILAASPDDLWVAQRIRRGELGKTTGKTGPVGARTPRPVKAVFIRGSTDRRALVIAGVHGSERQGMEVVELLLADLAQQPQPPAFTTIIVPSLFPDSKARGDTLAAAKAMGRMDEARESGPSLDSTPTNRNFPDPSKDLAAATNKKGQAVDKLGQAILPENQMLMQLMERFRPERIISVHGTKGPGSAGVFYDRRTLRADEVNGARDWARAMAFMQLPPDRQQEPGGEELLRELEDKLFRQRLAELSGQAKQTDRDLSLKAAAQIDKATEKIPNRDKRRFGREGESEKTIKAQRPLREKHPSVAGNVGASGALEHASWSGSTPKGVSLGGYAPARGMSVFTVEPPLNYRSDDPAKLEKLSEADRKLELKAYAEAIRTVLLGT